MEIVNSPRCSPGPLFIYFILTICSHPRQCLLLPQSSSPPLPHRRMCLLGSRVYLFFKSAWSWTPNATVNVQDNRKFTLKCLFLYTFFYYFFLSPTPLLAVGSVCVLECALRTWKSLAQPAVADVWALFENLKATACHVLYISHFASQTKNNNQIADYTFGAGIQLATTANAGINNNANERTLHQPHWDFDWRGVSKMLASVRANNVV